jgi:DMSO/TMAO reductase YedYZ heme-binding membrane subunit
MNLILPAERRLWYRSIFFTGVVFGLLVLYSLLYTGDASALMLSRAVAGTGGILIGLSFLLSSLCYFFDFADTKIGYRKYLGLIGYFFALAYSCMLLYIEPDRYLFGFFENFFSADFLLGITAMLIFTGMALISNSSMMMKIGPARWRVLLRFGYLAYGMLVVRAVILEQYEWGMWLSTFATLPPPRLLLSVFAIFVIGMRVAVMISKALSQKKPAVPRTIPPPVSTPIAPPATS